MKTIVFLLALVAAPGFAFGDANVVSSPAPWGQVGPTVTLAASNSSSRVLLGWAQVSPVPKPPPPSQLVCNAASGAVDAYVLLGDSSVTVTTSTGTYIPAGGCSLVATGVSTNTYLAAITASSSTTLTVMSGTGTPSASRGGGGSGSGGISQLTGDVAAGPGSGSQAATVLGVGNVTTGVLSATHGGAGTVNGIMKANGSGTVSAAAAGTDYAAAPTGSANTPLFNNGSGGFTNGTRSGNTTSVATTTGTLTSGHCAQWDASGNAVDSGGACGAGTVNYCEFWITGSGSFTGSGSCGSVTTTTWTTPSWITANTVASIEGFGAGGGGGGVGAVTNNFGVAGAAGGEFIISAKGLLSASTGYTFAVSNTGGAGGANTGGNGSTGGNTTLTVGGTTYAANGGTGGPGATSSSQSTAGGTASNGTFNITGQSGFTFIGTGTWLSVGGSTPYGYGGVRSTGAASDGVAATGFSSGGSGATAGSLGAAHTGGNGAPGLIHGILSGA